MLYKFCVIPDFNDVYDYVYERCRMWVSTCGLCVSTFCNDVAVRGYFLWLLSWSAWAEDKTAVNLKERPRH